MAASPFKKILQVALMMLVWFALIAQFYLIIQNRQASIAETVLRYFCYFTILSNILVAITISCWDKAAKQKLILHFNKSSTRAAVAVYIAVVAIVYNLVLRGLLHLQGLQWWVDELLHVAIPVGYILFWLCYTKQEKLLWNDVLKWLRFPFFYLCTVLCIGALLPSRFYPYPFLDAYNHGYTRVAISALAILGLFLLLSIIIRLLVNRFALKNK